MTIGHVTALYHTGILVLLVLHAHVACHYRLWPSAINARHLLPTTLFLLRLCYASPSHRHGKWGTCHSADCSTPFSHTPVAARDWLILAAIGKWWLRNTNVMPVHIGGYSCYSSHTCPQWPSSSILTKVPSAH